MTIIFLRTILLYLAIILALRILGKRQIGEMQPSELVITILISEVASIPMQDNSIPLIYGIISIFTLVSMELLLSYASLKSPFCRRMLSGKPSLIVHEGKIVQSELEKLRFSIDDLFEEMRMQGVWRISDIACGILETNGKFSVLLKPDAQPPTNKDLHIRKEAPGLVKIIVQNGKLLYGTIEQMGFTEEEILQKLHNVGLDASALYFCTIDGHGQIFEYASWEGRP